MRGFEYLDTYKKKFSAAPKDEFVSPKIVNPVSEGEEIILNTTEEEVVEDDRLSLTDKIKSMLTKIFEVEDQKIN
jgi:hypothetical protein